MARATNSHQHQAKEFIAGQLTDFSIFPVNKAEKP
jgi:hypothetical protein